MVNVRGHHHPNSPDRNRHHEGSCGNLESHAIIQVKHQENTEKLVTINIVAHTGNEISPTCASVLIPSTATRLASSAICLTACESVIRLVRHVADAEVIKECRSGLQDGARKRLRAHIQCGG